MVVVISWNLFYMEFLTEFVLFFMFDFYYEKFKK